MVPIKKCLRITAAIAMATYYNDMSVYYVVVMVVSRIIYIFILIYNL